MTEKSPLDREITARTDSYFNRTRRIVEKFGDAHVTYAVFLRRPVISAPRLAVQWLERVARERGTPFEIEVKYPEGAWVGAGDPLLYLSGSFAALADLETLYLQKLGPRLRGRAQCLSDEPRIAPRPLPSWRWRPGIAPASRCRR
jgi:nicotinate phosphoribosyltransferase